MMLSPDFHSDYTLIDAKGQEIPCHRVVLEYNCDYFVGRFSGSFGDIGDCTNLDFMFVREFVDFLYGGEFCWGSVPLMTFLGYKSHLKKRILELCQDDLDSSCRVAHRILTLLELGFTNDELLSSIRPKILFRILEQGYLVSDMSNEDIERNVRTLIELGVDLGVRGKNGMTILMVAAKFGYSDTVRHLISHGVDIHATDSNQNTALSYAARHGCIDSFRSLIEAGADIHAENTYGSTPLMCSVMDDCVETCTALLRMGANPNVERTNDTALSWACYSGSIRCTRLLIEVVDLECENIFRAIEWARKANNTECAMVVIDYLSKIDPTMTREIMKRSLNMN